MATFNINIDPIPPAWYTENYHLFQHEDCNPNYSARFSVGLWPAGEMAANTWIFSSVDPGFYGVKKSLRMGNFYSRDPLKFYFEYNGVPIGNTENLVDEPEITIDTEFLGQGEAIPGLFIVFNGWNTDQGGSLSAQMQMTDNQDKPGAWVYSRYNSQDVKCAPASEPEISIVSSTSNGCSSQTTVEVAVAAGSSRYVRIIPNDEFGTAAWEGTITETTQFALAIVGDSNGQYTTYSNLLITTSLDSLSTITIDSYQMARAHIGVTC